MLLSSREIKKQRKKKQQKEKHPTIDSTSNVNLLHGQIGKQPSQELVSLGRVHPLRSWSRKKKKSRNIACYLVVVVASNSIRVRRRISKLVYLCGGNKLDEEEKEGKQNERTSHGLCAAGGWGSSGKY